jgi:hypothetical protein
MMEADGFRLSQDAARIAMLTHKLRSSSGTAELGIWILILSVFLAAPLWASEPINLSSAETQRIGKKIWRNECNGTLAGLTEWNEGEDFASLGIGHFIWYPKNVHGPFDESFPKFVVFAADHQTHLPSKVDLKGHCPWKSRTEFQRESQTSEMKELRQFLANTVDLQAAFLVVRLRESLPKMLAIADQKSRDQVRENFDQLAKSANGCYALVDYVNFKGEGVLATERYAGQGWGLLQVLEGMSQETSDRHTVSAFAESARRVLSTRVHNAPPSRNENRWLSGWMNRISTYAEN